MLSTSTPVAKPSESQFEIMCLKALVASNWSFRQFEVGAFRDLLGAGYDYPVPSRKVIKARLTIEADRARNEIRQRFKNNNSRISLSLDCWTSPNRLEFMGMSLCSLIISLLHAIEAICHATLNIAGQVGGDSM